MPPPVFVTDRFLGMLQCAGDSSFAATRGGKTFFTYAQVATKDRGGSPTYVAVYDHRSGTIVQRRRVTRALPVNDTHTTPGICLDSQGYLHVVSGSHAYEFMYARSLLPADATLWTIPEPVLSSGWIAPGTDANGRGRQTYASLVCDGRDVLQLVYRQSRRGLDAWLGRDQCLALCIQSRPPSGRWSSPPILLALGKTEAGYVNYYQRLAISPSGRLFLAFCYYTHGNGRCRLRTLPTQDGPGVRRMVCGASRRRPICLAPSPVRCLAPARPADGSPYQPLGQGPSGAGRPPVRS